MEFIIRKRRQERVPVTRHAGTRTNLSAPAGQRLVPDVVVAHELAKLLAELRQRLPELHPVLPINLPLTEPRATSTRGLTP